MRVAAEAMAEHDAVVLLGMGGSSLAPEVLVQTFGVESFHVLDTTHPEAIRRLESKLDLGRTLFVSASKSGSTIETRSHTDYFWEKAQNGSQWLAITDPGSELEKLAAERGFRHVFAGEPTIGGRYSALSPFGMVPAALMGIDLVRLLEGALEMADACRGADGNRGLEMGLGWGEGWREGRDKICIEGGGSFGLWAEQLVAESTGKQGKGLVPAPGEEGVGDDRLQQEVELSDPYELGKEFFRWEFATAVAGHVLDINPFDQPNVQEAKDRTKELLASGERPSSSRSRRPRSSSPRRSRGLRVHPGVRPALGGERPRDCGARVPGARGDRVRRHARLRAALPALDGTAPQGRGAERALPPGRRRHGRGAVDPGPAVRLRPADLGAGRGRLRSAEGARPPGRAHPAVMTWEERLAATWDALDELPEDTFRARVDPLAEEAPDGAVAAFGRACAFDSTGLSDRAFPLYREALAAGLGGIRRRRATIQLTSSLRNFGRADGASNSSAPSGTREPTSSTTPSAGSSRWRSRHGEEREGLALALEALAPPLPRYQRSLGNYARS